MTRRVHRKETPNESSQNPARDGPNTCTKRRRWQRCRGETPGPTPIYGLTGGCNMTNPNAAFGMFTIAGSLANPNGFDVGMITAILNTFQRHPRFVQLHLQRLR